MKLSSFGGGLAGDLGDESFDTGVASVFPSGGEPGGDLSSGGRLKSAGGFTGAFNGGGDVGATLGKFIPTGEIGAGEYGGHEGGDDGLPPPGGSLAGHNGT